MSYNFFVSSRFSVPLQQYCPFRLTAFMCRTAAVLRSFLLVKRGTNNAETKEAALVVSAVAAPVAHPAGAVVAVIAATTVIAVVAVVRVNIPTPLKHIAAHIVESVSVGFLLCYWMCFSSTVTIIPAYFIKIIAS